MTRKFAFLCSIILLAMGFLAVFSKTPANSQQLAPCTITDASNAVIIVLCPRGQSEAKWKEAGEAACSNREPCSAWIWDDAAKAPRIAPKLPDAFPKEAVLASIAIWDNDGKQLVLIRKDANQ